MSLIIQFRTKNLGSSFSRICLLKLIARVLMDGSMENDPCFYTSAPASPGRLSLESLCFNGDEFEFETSRRFNVDEHGDVGSESEPKPKSQLESLPAMAFADELFSDGKVRPLVLKPPPRLQYPDDNKFDKQSSTLSSPRSPTAVLKLPFQRRSLWNDDFDPFMVALKNVKEEKVGRCEAKNHRRARSMSPFREIRPNGGRSSHHQQQQPQQINQMGLILPTQQSNRNIMGRREHAKQVKRSPIRLAEPKGVLFARRARLVKMGHEKPIKPSVISPTSETGDGEKEPGLLTCTREIKSHRFKNFLFRSGSLRKISSEDKPGSSYATESKPNLARKFGFKPMGLTHYNEEKRVSEVTRMTLVQYRPKLLLCMGYGA